MERSASGEADSSADSQIFITGINLLNRTDCKFYHKRTLTAGPSCLPVAPHYMHVPRPLQLAVPSNCATPSTPSLATPTQSADSGRIGTEVCRALIVRLHIGLHLCRKYETHNGKCRHN